MKNRYLLPTFAVVITAAVSFGANALAQSFTEPSSPPPQNNAYAPLDVSATPQSKTAGLILNNNGSAAYGLITGGSVSINNLTPPLTPVTTLNVNGNVGATAYCDVNGQNCITPGGSSGGSALTTLAGVTINSCQVYQNTYGHTIFLFFATGGAGAPNGWAAVALNAGTPGATWVQVAYASDSNSSGDGNTITTPIPAGWSYQVCYQNARYARLLY